MNRRTFLQHTLVYGSAATLAAPRTSSLDTAVRRQIKLVMKPHGGRSGASAEIAAALQAVRHANFKMWYDAGNIIYYTNKDAVEELKPIAQHVTGFCAKDCGARQGEVIQAAGFDGPIMVECCKVGASAEETMTNAPASRVVLERVLAQV